MRRVRLSILCAALLVWGAAGGWPLDLAPAGSIRGARAAVLSIPYRIDYRSSLSGWWRLADGAGTSAADSSGLGRAASLANGAVFGSGYASFDGTDDYLAPPSAATVAGAAQATLCLWVWPSEWAPASTGAVLYRETTSTSVVRLQLLVQTTGAMQMNGRLASADPAGSTTSFAVSPVVSPALNQWHHVCGVLKSGDHAIYLDGSRIATGTATTTALGSSPATTIGVMGYAGSAVYTSLGGRLADVRLWVGRAMSAAEVSALYRRGRQ